MDERQRTAALRLVDELDQLPLVPWCQPAKAAALLRELAAEPETLGQSQPLDVNLQALATKPATAIKAYGVEWAGWCAASAIKEIERLAAEPVQEPVAWMMTPNKLSHPNLMRSVQFDKPTMRVDWELTPLYAHPPQQRKPLTQDEVLDMAEGCTLQFHDLLAFARAIEKAITGEQK